MENYDVIIVGGGPMGLATAAELSKYDNKQTLVLEQFDFINQKGSSAGLSRQFRVQYAQIYMAQLALDAVEYWDALQQSTEKVLIDKVGSLWFGDPEISSQEGGITQAMKVMDELNIPYEPLDAKAIEARFPFQNIPSDYNGFFQKDGGIINLQATQEALLSICKSAPNVHLSPNTPVTQIESVEGGGITVRSGGQEYKASKLIISPGAYINEILKNFNLTVDVDIWEMSSAYYKKNQDISFPTWFVFQEPQNTSLFYGFPEEPWAHPGYIRVAPDIPDKIINDPSERNPEPSRQSLAYNEAWVKNHMIGLEPCSEYTATCLITLSDDNKEMMLDYLPDSVPNHKDIIAYTGGWAAKFIPLLGKILTDLALQGTTDYDISNFKIKYETL